MHRNKKDDLNIIKQAAKLYRQNLLDKNILFVYLRDNKIEFYEVSFLKEHFKHLTGTKSRLNAYEFFYRASNNRLRLDDFEYKDNTTILKLNNLIKSMVLNQYSKMIGEYKENKRYLSLEKISGNNNLMIGFDKGENINYPKTLLKGDIRDYTYKVYRIIAIISKSIKEDLYKEINYIAKNITIDRILKNEDLKNILNTEFIIEKYNKKKKLG